jgi:uncharacterized protein (TIGR03067 family)
MRRLSLSFAVLCVLLLGSESSTEYDDQTMKDGLEGRWELVGHQYKGHNSDLSRHRVVLVFHRTTFVFEIEGAGSLPGTYRSDATCRPAHLDWTYQAARLAVKQIYRVEGDTLQVARNPDDSDKRPQGFNDKVLEIETYRRAH